MFNWINVIGFTGQSILSTTALRRYSLVNRALCGRALTSMQSMFTLLKAGDSLKLHFTWHRIVCFSLQTLSCSGHGHILILTVLLFPVTLLNHQSSSFLYIFFSFSVSRIYFICLLYLLKVLDLFT